MRRVSAFLEFARREQDGTIWKDPSYRAYDLDRRHGHTGLKRAIRYIGYFSLYELKCDLNGMGYRGLIVAPLMRWWVWHRLTMGDLVKWPLRTDRSKRNAEQKVKQASGRDRTEGENAVEADLSLAERIDRPEV